MRVLRAGSEKKVMRFLQFAAKLQKRHRGAFRKKFSNYKKLEIKIVARHHAKRLRVNSNCSPGNGFFPKQLL